MSEELLLAIDAGTGSCRAVVFDADGRQVAIGQREYTHRELPGVPGSQVFDTARNWALICASVREALREVTPTAVKAVSATSMREGMVLYDARGQEVWACPNVDSRAGVEAGELVTSGVAEEIYREAGDWVSITAPARFRWIARHEPELFRSIAHVGMLGDWILTRLTGEFVTDPSLGSSSGMFALARRDWSERVLDICDLDLGVFPAVVDPGTPIGVVTRDAARDTGLPAGTPVVVGGADTQLSLLGIGVTEPGRLTIVAGSFWQCTAVVDQPLIDPAARLRTLCHTVPGRWMMEGLGFYSGIVMRWFRDGFCELEALEAARTGEDVYALMERKAADIPPGANGIFGLFSNVMQASRWVHGPPGFLGFDVSDPAGAGRIACFRAIEEGTAYVTRAHVEIVQDVAGVIPREAVLTGGAAKGSLWPQIVADTIGIPIRIPVVKESTALGAAIYAGVGAGLYDDAGATAERLVQTERIVEPVPSSAEAYEELYERWRALYGATLQLSETGLVRPLWRAAGT
jgi:autoinducer 2 (AI-2) kinase